MTPPNPSSDLSTIHGPIGDLFSDRQRATSRLTDEQLQSYAQNGYVAGIRVLRDSQIAALRAELHEFFAPDHAGRQFWYEYHTNESTQPDTVLFHALGAWRIREAFHDILWHTQITQPASQLLQGSVRFWHDQLFCKPARHGGVVAWHQDFSYWTRTTPMAHLSCWIGLDDSTPDNGCLQYIPGSHRWNLLPRTELAGAMDGIHKVLSDEQWEAFQHPVTIELKAGECAFHHPLMVHGSFENRTDGPRRAVVLNFVRDGVGSASDDPLLEGVPPIPMGQPLSGQFFPLLLNAAPPGE